MAMLWQQDHRGKRYEVRTAGRSLRLYTDGVFHSQYNPSRPLTGSVWDLLMLPAFFYPPQSIQRVLVLGVGGGAAIRLLQHFVSPAEILGIELNPVHIRIARRFFGVKGRGVRLVRGDAVQWLDQYQGPRFDTIIDDLFGEEEGEPVRAVAADCAWASALLKRLSPRGLIVTNFASGVELRRSAYWASESLRRRFSAGYQLTTPLYGNVVAAMLRISASPRTLREHLMATPGLNPERKTTGLRYQIRRL